MLAPVVVKPDTVSKRASMKLGIAPEKMKGSAPKRLIKTQLAETMAKPSLAKSSLFFGLPKRTRRIPHITESSEVIRNAKNAGS